MPDKNLTDTQPDEPVDLLKVRHDLGQTIMLGAPHPDECLQIYKNLGPSRSLSKVRQYLVNQGRKAPAETTLKKWSKKLNWQFHVREYDVEVARRVDENRKAELAKEAQVDLSNLSVKMREVAHKALYRLKTKIEALPIKSGGEFRAVSEAVVALNRAAEVLDGGVGDRTESIQTVEERKTAAMKIVDEAFAKVNAGSGNDNGTKRRGLNQYTDYEGRAAVKPSDATRLNRHGNVGGHIPPMGDAAKPGTGTDGV